MMKKLLVLTDMTTNAAHAAGIAVRLADKLSMDIVLYYTMPYVPLIPSDSGGPYASAMADKLFDDSRERLHEEVEWLKGHSGNVSIIEKSGEGSLSEVITELTEDPDIEMVVMGGRMGGALDHLFSGSDTAKVIRKAKKPVLIIPITTGWYLPQKVVFATDYSDADIAAVSFVQALSAKLGFTLNIIHVLRRGEEVFDIQAEVEFRKYLNGYQLTCEHIFDESVHQGLQRYCRLHKADVLAMSHGHHTFFARKLGKSESRSAIADGQLAVLVFPPECFITKN